MLPSRKTLPNRTPSTAAIQAADGACYVAITLRVLAVSGYGMWCWLGMALALGIHRIGRGDDRMPLALAAVLVGAGLVLAWRQLHAPSQPGDWRTEIRRKRLRAAWVALASYLPMLLVLALGGMASNDSALARLAGVLLLLSSVTTLVYTANSYRGQLSPGQQRASSSLPIIRVVAAWYGGGLWLWLCAALQGGLASPEAAYPWILLLLVLSLALGLMEVLRWQSVDAPIGAVESELLALGQPPTRFAAALLVYVVPCLALLAYEHFGYGLTAAMIAVPSCLLGTILEQYSYESTLVEAAPRRR